MHFFFPSNNSILSIPAEDTKQQWQLKTKIITVSATFIVIDTVVVNRHNGWVLIMCLDVAGEIYVDLSASYFDESEEEVAFSMTFTQFHFSSFF